MRILIDIGHPAHVHYFRNFYKQMVKNGHNILVTARRKEVSHELLKSYNMPYISRGSGGNSFLGKLLYLPKANYVLFKEAIRFKPDMFLSFSSPYAAQVSKLFGKPHIALDDTEHAKLGRLMYGPFTDVVISPRCYKGPVSKKQLLFDGYLDISYLHPKYYTPKKNVYDFLKLKENEKYAVVRFVSWNANHDMHGQNSGLSPSQKEELVNHIEKKMHVIISSEVELPAALEKHRAVIPPDAMHDLMHFADLFVGESLTMASEAALLGTPSICVSTISAGTTDDQVKRGLVIKHNSYEGVIDSIDLCLAPGYKELLANRKDLFFDTSTDLTALMVKLIENYPESISDISQKNTDKIR